MSDTALIHSSSSDVARSTLAFGAISRDSGRPSTAPSPLNNAAAILPSLRLTPQRDPVGKGSVPSASSPSSRPPTPAGWEHPRIDEVMRRQARTRFDGRNTRVIIRNIALIVASVVVPMMIYKLSRQTTLRLRPYDFWTLTAFRTICLLNALSASWPLFRKPDPCNDVPLTPTQRQLLGLPPMSRPALPQEEKQYTTPPRFPRSSATPPSSRRAHASNSPLDGSLRRSFSGSPYGSAQQQRNESPLAASLRARHRRSSYTSPRSSPVGLAALDDSSISLSDTPSKMRRSSVALNSKWLYEKGRGSPGTKMSGSGWGTGSVFN